jgi:hypothetical protein
MSTFWCRRTQRVPYARASRARVAIRGLRERLVLSLFERVEAALLGEHPLVESGDLPVPGVGRVGAREHALGFIGGELPREPRGSQKEASPGGALFRVARVPQQAGKVLLPGPCLDLDVAEAAAGLGVIPPAGPEAAGIRRRRLLPVALVAQHVAQLEQQLAGVRSIGAGLELQLEELLDHVQLAQIPVDGASRLEALDQRGIELVGVLEVLERLHAREELPLEDVPELQVELRLRRVGGGRRDPLLELLDETLPVPDFFQIRETLL